MFDVSDANFIRNNMKIDIASIEAQLNSSQVKKYQHIIIGAIKEFIEEIRKFEASGVQREIFTFKNNIAEDYINSRANTLSEEIDNEYVKQTLDALRHSFACYAFNGLHQLYTRQENEGWHPKIVLTEVLTPNDIDTLDENIKLYRGCDISEYNTEVYGQAWTTSQQMAEMFAFTHYQGQKWFNTGSRIVIETTYSREHVLFSDQSIEFEVVIDVSKLTKVVKHI